jgi:hypothetical protein
MSQKERAISADSAFGSQMHSGIVNAARTGLESIFASTNSRFSALIESTVQQANLQARRKQIDEGKRRRLEILKEIIKWGFTGGGIFLVGNLVLRAIGVLK